VVGGQLFINLAARNERLVLRSLTRKTYIVANLLVTKELQNDARANKLLVFSGLKTS
jgi:hypothetical protein